MRFRVNSSHTTNRCFTVHVMFNDDGITSWIQHLKLKSIASKRWRLFCRRCCGVCQESHGIIMIWATHNRMGCRWQRSLAKHHQIEINSLCTIEMPSGATEVNLQVTILSKQPAWTPSRSPFQMVSHQRLHWPLPLMEMCIQKESLFSFVTITDIDNPPEKSVFLGLLTLMVNFQL